MPGMVFARGSVLASGRYWAMRCSATQPGDALAHRDLQLVGRLVDVLADLPAECDGDQFVAHPPVDADVVIVDQLAQLGADRQADVADVREVIESRPELLDRLQLGRPGRHLLEVLGGTDGHAGLRPEGRDRLELVRGPLVRFVVVDVEKAEHVVAVEQRRRAHRVETLLDDRRTDIGAPRVISVVGREQRSAGGDRIVRQTPAPGSRAPRRCTPPTGRG